MMDAFTEECPRCKRLGEAAIKRIDPNISTAQFSNRVNAKLVYSLGVTEQIQEVLDPNEVLLSACDFRIYGSLNSITSAVTNQNIYFIGFKNDVSKQNPVIISKAAINIKQIRSLSMKEEKEVLGPYVYRLQIHHTTGVEDLTTPYEEGARFFQQLNSIYASSNKTIQSESEQYDKSDKNKLQTSRVEHPYHINDSNTNKAITFTAKQKGLIVTLIIIIISCFLFMTIMDWESIKASVNRIIYTGSSPFPSSTDSSPVLESEATRISHQVKAELDVTMLEEFMIQMPDIQSDIERNGQYRTFTWTFSDGSKFIATFKPQGFEGSGEGLVLYSIDIR